MLFVAQLWKQNGDRLENKNGDWMYMGQTWIFPGGLVLKDSLGRVLKAKSDSIGMHLKLKAGTIHLRHWQSFTIFDPYPPSCQQPSAL